MTERSIVLNLKLLDDCVFSESPASAGAHAGLDYIPGSALLGWAATRLYDRFDADESWLVFHSGKVRFGPGLPLAENGRIAWPAPMSLHFAKGDAWRDEVSGRVVRERLVNLARGDREPGVQYQQLRNTWLTTDGLVHHPAHDFSMKTAIDPDTGRAAESQLYGYDALRAGQRFVATVRADADVPADVLDRLAEAFDGELHLGRSRSSQYGRVRATPGGDAPAVPGVREAGRELVVWVLSDLAASRNGQPCLAPEPADLGLPSGRLVRERSFVRARAWSPFNAWRRAPDVERQVIAAGSVLTFVFDEPVDAAGLPESLGLWRESGLGCVSYNPVLLAEAHPRLEAAVAPEEASEDLGTNPPAHPLVKWLVGLADRESKRKRIHHEAETIVKRLIDEIYPGVERLAAGEAQPPGATQWGHVRGFARNVSDGEELVRQLFEGDGPIKPGGNNPDWNAPTFGPDGNPTTIREWLKARIEALEMDLRAPIVARVAQRMGEELRKGKQKGGKA